VDVIAGTVVRVNGPVVEVAGLDSASMLELVEVGDARLPGEIIALGRNTATVQVYEYTGGLRPGERVVATGGALAAELGPGLIGGVFDGMLRRLAGAAEFLEVGARPATLDRSARWTFEPLATEGGAAEPGSILGRVPETPAIEHRVLVPPDLAGTVEWIASDGEYTVDEPIARVAGREVTLVQRWPVRRARPVRARLDAVSPLGTGQRALDLLFPLARGGTAAVPGGFGTGKTVLLQQIAKWCDASVIVYVGCGERGNELADVLHELSELQDPTSGRRLLDRTVLVANTSNMPVLAREASIYTGLTVAEYYRDQGHEAVVIADSTSRWAEALREVASRTGQLPAEEGYPPGLASALAAFYERAGRVQTLSGAEASVTVLGAVSPPAGDMAEPVSAHTRRFVRSLWSLDRDLAYARHHPAVSWRDSFCRDADALASWHALHGDWNWGDRRTRALTLLAEADRVEAIAQLIGAASLPNGERMILLTGRLLREAVLQQSALSANDTYCEPAKQAALLDMVLALHDRFLHLLEQGVAADRIEEVDLGEAARVRDETRPGEVEAIEAVRDELLTRLEALV
jgi:V/A-type H+-transporting ATPase subunit A